MTTLQVIGTPVSPFVRKVLVCLELKGLHYQLDPVVAFYTGAEFENISPLRLIPVLIDGETSLCDSTVICEYIDDAYSGYDLLPKSPRDRADARWLDEYADTQLAEVLLWKLFNEAIINPSVWGKKRDLSALESIMSEDIPVVMRHLESVLPEQGFLFGDLCLADISIAVQFRNAAWARYRPSASDWPITSAFIDRVLSTEAFMKLARMEDTLVKTPILQQRQELERLGVELTEHSFMVDAPPRPGPRTSLR